jgi:hypothetical protein
MMKRLVRQRRWEFSRLNKEQTKNFNLIIPTGTQIVTLIEAKALSTVDTVPRGAVGVIVSPPQDNFHSYRARFPDGNEAMLKRQEFAIKKHFSDLERATALDDMSLDEFVIYRCIVGSRAYGLDHDSSDVDRRGIYLPSAEMQWSLYGVPEQIEHKESEECYWEIKKFLMLALKANPNALECLYTPLIEYATPLAQELLRARSMFLSKLVYQTYNGYVLSQFKKLEQDLRARGEIKWKHAMHLIRLLLQGVGVLREGVLPVRVEDNRERLLAIRRGELEWREVNEWRLSLHKDFDQAFAQTNLPERPDYEKANAFLIKARREMV